MKTKLFFLSILVSLGMTSGLLADGTDFQSWKEWATPVTSAVTKEQVIQFRSTLPKESLHAFDDASPTTQILSVVIYNGLQSTVPSSAPSSLCSMAFKIANKAEVGFYLDKAVRRLDY